MNPCGTPIRIVFPPAPAIAHIIWSSHSRPSPTSTDNSHPRSPASVWRWWKPNQFEYNNQSPLQKFNEKRATSFTIFFTMKQFCYKLFPEHLFYLDDFFTLCILCLKKISPGIDAPWLIYTHNICITCIYMYRYW